MRPIKAERIFASNKGQMGEGMRGGSSKFK
jgi:hypothetical protein